jgi:hypothetical protein
MPQPHGIDWLSEDLIGDLPREWNHLVGYDAPRSDAKLVHYTQGMPIFEETPAANTPRSGRRSTPRPTRPWVGRI